MGTRSIPGTRTAVPTARTVHGTGTVQSDVLKLTRAQVMGQLEQPGNPGHHKTEKQNQLPVLTTETKQSPDWIQRQNILSIPAMLSIGWSR